MARGTSLSLEGYQALPHFGFIDFVLCWFIFPLGDLQEFFGWASYPLGLCKNSSPLLCFISRFFADFATCSCVCWFLLGWGNSVFGLVIKSLVLDLSTLSCVNLSTYLVTFKDSFFGWASFPFGLCKNSFPLSRFISRLFPAFALVLVSIGLCSAGATFSLDVYQAYARTPLLSRVLSVVPLLILHLFLCLLVIARLGQLCLWSGYQVTRFGFIDFVLC
ncbi:unnamed protein product [Absidia cylindrospora]